ncbi:MAG: selenide, water dikinase SelD [Anaerorhabdus sp.]
MKKDILPKCTNGGCGAKIGSNDLHDMLGKIPKVYSKDLLVGFDSSDDAAIYKINDQQAIVSTTDFFPPMVQDPYTFGQIAAANALSDIYAMGADVLFALNLVCFPQSLDKEILEKILQGGASILQEANAVLSGGHSIYDHETKYGLAVTGIVNPEKFYKNNTIQENDVLILTKPLGVGLILAAHRQGDVNDDSYTEVVSSMTHLNKYASEKCRNYNISACTDVTGFGLLNHLLEMLNNNFSANLYMSKLPLFNEVELAIKSGHITGGAKRNRLNAQQYIDLSVIDEVSQEIILDPQTSGGLLIAVNKSYAEELLKDILKDDPHAKIIAEITKKEDKIINFR